MRVLQFKKKIGFSIQFYNRLGAGAGAGAR